jgi:riboflavin synthase
MFTGIIEETGHVIETRPGAGGLRFTVEAPLAAEELRVGDSVSVNGVCQTVVALTRTQFTVQAVEETLKKTTLGGLTLGESVNIELPVRLNGRLGGHLVLGHVDCVATVVEVSDRESSRVMTIEFPAHFGRYVVPVGSIAIDGISLTIASVNANQLTVSLIPHTLEKTTLARARAGSRLNVEFDVIGKHVERLMQGEQSPGGSSPLTPAKLREWGYRVDEGS